MANVKLSYVLYDLDWGIGEQCQWVNSHVPHFSLFVHSDQKDWGTGWCFTLMTGDRHKAVTTRRRMPSNSCTEERTPSYIALELDTLVLKETWCGGHSTVPVRDRHPDSSPRTAGLAQLRGWQTTGMASRRVWDIANIERRRRRRNCWCVWLLKAEENVDMLVWFWCLGFLFYNSL
jgi:hypothetical protein